MQVNTIASGDMLGCTLSLRLPNQTHWKICYFCEKQRNIYHDIFTGTGHYQYNIYPNCSQVNDWYAWVF